MNPRLSGEGSPEHRSGWCECRRTSSMAFFKLLFEEPAPFWHGYKEEPLNTLTKQAGIPKHRPGQQVEIQAAPGKLAHPPLSSESPGSGCCSHIRT